MSKKTKISKYDRLAMRLAELEQLHKKDAKMIADLLDYLMRVDKNFKNHPGTFEGWYHRLVQMRNEDNKRKECASAQRILEEQGYIVAVDDQGVDAARLKKWLHNPKIINAAGSLPILPDDDDDIPS